MTEFLKSLVIIFGAVFGITLAVGGGWIFAQQILGLIGG